MEAGQASIGKVGTQRPLCGVTPFETWANDNCYVRVLAPERPLGAERGAEQGAERGMERGAAWNNGVQHSGSWYRGTGQFHS